MAKKKECETCKLTAEFLEQAKRDVDTYREQLAVYRSMARENIDAKSQLLQNSMELERAQHRIELIKLIVAGKKAEAVEYLLQAKPLLFTIDVQYADSETEIAAKTERANACADLAAKAVREAMLPKVKAESVAARPAA